MSLSLADARFLFDRALGLIRRGMVSLHTRGWQASWQRVRVQLRRAATTQRVPLYAPEPAPFAPFGVPPGQPYYVSSVSFGIETASSAGANQPVTVRLHTNSGGAFPLGTLTQIASVTLNVTDQSNTILAVPLSVTVPAGTSGTGSGIPDICFGSGICCADAIDAMSQAIRNAARLIRPPVSRRNSCKSARRGRSRYRRRRSRYARPSSRVRRPPVWPWRACDPRARPALFQ